MEATVKNIKKILVKRGIIDMQKHFAYEFSGKRTNNIEKLTNDEYLKLYNVLNEYTKEYLINGIYQICFETGIIKSTDNTPENECLIMDFYRVIAWVNRGISLPSDCCFLKLSYKETYLMCEEIGNDFMKKRVQLN